MWQPTPWAVPRTAVKMLENSLNKSLHLSGAFDNIMRGDVSVVSSLITAFSFSGWFAKGFDDQGGGRSCYLLLGPSILKGQFHWTPDASSYWFPWPHPCRHQFFLKAHPGLIWEPGQNWYPLPHQHTQDPQTSVSLRLNLGVTVKMVSGNLDARPWRRVSFVSFRPQVESQALLFAICFWPCWLLLTGFL